MTAIVFCQFLYGVTALLCYNFYNCDYISKRVAEATGVDTNGSKNNQGRCGMDQ